MSESSGHQCATIAIKDKEPLVTYVSKNGRIVAFDFFVPCFPRKRFSCYS
jgi:hypothetical protein